MYDNNTIADELYKTAQGISYYGNALRVAKDMPCVTPEDRSILDRFAVAGFNCTFEERMRLQDIAIKVRQEGRKKE